MTTLLSVLGLQEWIFWAFRVVAGLGTLVVAWFILGPLIQALVRIALHKKLPKWAVTWLRTIGAVVLGMLVYYYLPVGGGPGWGPGTGGPSSGPGSGTGQQGKNGKHAGTKDEGKPTEGKKDSSKETSGLGKDVLEIELLGGARYKRDERYYLLGKKEPAKTIAEVDEHLKQSAGKYRIVHVVLTKESVSEEDPAVSRLQRLVQQKYKLAAPVVLP